MSTVTKTIKCNWCGVIVAVTDNSSNYCLCSVCEAQKAIEVQAHEAYIATRTTEVATINTAMKDETEIRATIEATKLMDFTVMSTDELKASLANIKVRLDKYFL